MYQLIRQIFYGPKIVHAINHWAQYYLVKKISKVLHLRSTQDPLETHFCSVGYGIALILIGILHCTLGEMTRLESHQVENEIFEFLKNFFSMAQTTSSGILKCIFLTLGPSDQQAVDAFLKHFWYSQNNRKSAC